MMTLLLNMRSNVVISVGGTFRGSTAGHLGAINSAFRVNVIIPDAANDTTQGIKLYAAAGAANELKLLEMSGMSMRALEGAIV
jgi:hypothetical protein